jgi:hypothetical protein
MGAFMRYFFDLFIDGNVIPDNEGKEFETVEAVQEAAVELALELKREFPRIDGKTVGSVMAVSREDGTRVFAFPIHEHSFCCDTVL